MFKTSKQIQRARERAKVCVTHAEIDVYLTMAGSYRAYVPSLTVDAWGAFRSSAIRKLVDNMVAQNIVFDLSEAPRSFYKD